MSQQIEQDMARRSEETKYCDYTKEVKAEYNSDRNDTFIPRHEREDTSEDTQSENVEDNTETIIVHMLDSMKE